MNKFRIGDTVRRVDTWDLSVGLPSGEVGIVSVLRGNDIVEIKGYGDWLHNTENLELVEQIDDELPPAPESVQYTTLQYAWQDKYNDQHLTASPDSFANGICIHIQGSTTSQCNKDMALSVILYPDEILQLCHDLRRMAMEIKRKEKDND